MVVVRIPAEQKDPQSPIDDCLDLQKLCRGHPPNDPADACTVRDPAVPSLIVEHVELLMLEQTDCRHQVSVSPDLLAVRFHWLTAYPELRMAAS